jgi:hypothetical protein
VNFKIRRAPGARNESPKYRPTAAMRRWVSSIAPLVPPLAKELEHVRNVRARKTCFWKKLLAYYYYYYYYYCRCVVLDCYLIKPWHYHSFRHKATLPYKALPANASHPLASYIHIGATTRCPSQPHHISSQRVFFDADARFEIIPIYSFRLRWDRGRPKELH